MNNPFWRENHISGLWELSHEKPFFSKVQNSCENPARNLLSSPKPGSRQQAESGSGQEHCDVLGRSRAEVSLSCLTERPALRNSLRSLPRVCQYKPNITPPSVRAVSGGRAASEGGNAAAVTSGLCSSAVQLHMPPDEE